MFSRPRHPCSCSRRTPLRREPRMPCSRDSGARRVAIDPVCGMKVDPATAKHRFSYKGQDYFFCGARCRERFAAEPEKFLSRARRLRPPRLPAPSTPVRCIPRCGRSDRAVARSAAWRWSPSRSRSTGPRSRTDRHDAAVLDRAGADRSRCSCSKWAAISA